jgi:hypothetical protein
MPPCTSNGKNGAFLHRPARKGAQRRGGQRRRSERKSCTVRTSVWLRRERSRADSFRPTSRSTGPRAWCAQAIPDQITRWSTRSCCSRPPLTAEGVPYHANAYGEGRNAPTRNSSRHYLANILVGPGRSQRPKCEHYLHSFPHSLDDLRDTARHRQDSEASVVPILESEFTVSWIAQ